MLSLFSFDVASKAAPMEKLYDALVSKLRLKDLFLLCSIADRKSLTVVADELGVSQPAVSRLLKEIEAAFGNVLFERDRTEGMRPTPAGTLVLTRIRALLSDVGAMSDELEAYAAGTGGHLRIGVIPFVSGRLLQSLVLDLIGQEHRMSVAVTEGSTDVLVHALSQHTLDAVIGRMSRKPFSTEVHQEALFQQKVCLIAHIHHSLTSKKSFKLTDLSNQLWLLPPKESPTRIAINETFSAAGVAPPVASIETAATKLIYDVIRTRTDMLGVIPFEVGRDLERLGGVSTLPFPTSFNLPPVALITLSGQRNAPAIRNLRRSLRDRLAQGLPLS